MSAATIGNVSGFTGPTTVRATVLAWLASRLATDLVKTGFDTRVRGREPLLSFGNRRVLVAPYEALRVPSIREPAVTREAFA